uniref:Putative zinc finger, BED-type n=1 Tax=Tanacetum cinerariifolium TaxID=118510 RepID=A0A6L2J4D1_TANCI|nr:putative zinc finger, BED-type [Tanacetum cinerariifolium]
MRNKQSIKDNSCMRRVMDEVDEYDEDEEDDCIETTRRERRGKTTNDERGLPSNAASYASFHIAMEAVAQIGQGFKPPSMYDLRQMVKGDDRERNASDASEPAYPTRASTSRGSVQGLTSTPKGKGVSHTSTSGSKAYGVIDEDCEEDIRLSKDDGVNEKLEIDVDDDEDDEKNL